MSNYQELLNIQLGNNTLGDYFLALAVFAAAYIILKIFKLFILKRLRRLAEKTKTDLDDAVVAMIGYLNWPFYFVFSLYIAVQILVVSGLAKQIFYYLFIITIVYYAVRLAGLVVEFLAKKAILKDQENARHEHQAVINMVSKLIKFVLWVIAIILLLSNFGFNVSSLIAGLGIGGIAVALAIQNILGDLFSSLSLYFDRPFQVGDYIMFGTEGGVVKKIGLKTTRIQALQGEELVVPNNDLTNARVQNFKKLERRRSLFLIGVTYETPKEKLEKIPGLITEVINKVQLADADRVHFKNFGDYSLNFEVVYFVNSDEYPVFMDVQEKVNLGIVEAFEREGIEFAYPTQTVLVRK